MDLLEALTRLPGALSRARGVVGVARRGRADAASHRDLRTREAMRRMGALGYDGRDAAATFRREAGLRSAGAEAASDDATWAALDELRGLEADVDVRRWRRDGTWLPAMRRALVVRVRELTTEPSEREAMGPAPPTSAEVRAALRRCGLVARGVDDEGLARALLSHRRLVALVDADGRDDRPARALRRRIASEASVLLGLAPGRLQELRERRREHRTRSVEARLQRRADRRATRRRGRARGGRRATPRRSPGSTADRRRQRRATPLGERLFAALAEREELLRAPTEEEIDRLWPQVVAALPEPDVLTEAWREFLADPAAIWRGRGRARSWLRGVATLLGEEGRDLEEGLRALRAGDDEYGVATRRKLFQVLYHRLAEVFAAIDGAMACFVEIIDAEVGLRRRVALRRRVRGVAVFAATAATAHDLVRARERITREDQSLLVAAELLGVVAGVSASWIGGALSPGVVVTSIAKVTPRLLELSRQLAAIWSPAAD